MILEVGKVEKGMSKYWECLVLSSLMGLLHTEDPETLKRFKKQRLIGQILIPLKNILSDFFL